MWCTPPPPSVPSFRATIILALRLELLSSMEAVDTSAEPLGGPYVEELFLEAYNLQVRVCVCVCVFCIVVST